MAYVATDLLHNSGFLGYGNYRLEAKTKTTNAPSNDLYRCEV